MKLFTDELQVKHNARVATLLVLPCPLLLIFYAKYRRDMAFRATFRLAHRRLKRSCLARHHLP